MKKPLGFKEMKRGIFLLIPILGMIGMLLFSYIWTNKENEKIGEYAAALLEQLFSTEGTEAWKEALWEEEASALSRYFQIKEEANQKMLKQLFQESYGSAKFEILEIVESKENFSVKIKIYPKLFFAEADKKAKELWRDIKEKNENYEYQKLTEEEYQKIWEEQMMEGIGEAFQTKEYAQPIELELPLIKNGGGSWEIPQEALQLIYRKVFSYGIEEE